MFVISLRYVKSLETVDRYIEEHKAYLEKYYALGKFIVSGRKEPRTGGVILANAVSVAEVDSIIEEDPFFKAQVAEYDVIEMIPSMTAPGLDVFKGFI